MFSSHLFLGSAYTAEIEKKKVLYSTSFVGKSNFQIECELTAETPPHGNCDFQVEHRDTHPQIH